MYDWTEEEAIAEKEYILHYFGVMVRGEPIRMLLSHSNVPFEDRRIKGEDWP